jgi:hypothetical protein
MTSPLGVLLWCAKPLFTATRTLLALIGFVLALPMLILNVIRLGNSLGGCLHDQVSHVAYRGLRCHAPLEGFQQDPLCWQDCILELRRPLRSVGARRCPAFVSSVRLQVLLDH